MRFPSARRRRARKVRAVMANDESEELLLKAYGKTSWELADEAERGYDLTKIKHEFAAVSDREPCRVCSQPKYSWPHLAREITNPESY